MSTRNGTRRLILAEIIERLSTIDTGRGSETDAGYRVFLGQHVTIGPDDPAIVLAVVPGDTEITNDSTRKILFDWPIEIQVIAKTDDRAGWYLNAEATLADVQAVMEDDAKRLNGFPIEIGPTRQLEGEQHGGMAITYIVKAQQTWGRP